MNNDLRSNITYKEVNYSYVIDNLSEIVDFSTKTFIKYHENTNHAWMKTEPKYQYDFTTLFRDHVKEMIEKANLHQEGKYFIAEDAQKKKIVAFSLGTAYGRPLLSEKFLSQVQSSKSCMKEIFSDWVKLMKKYPTEAPAAIFHQGFIAVRSKYLNQGIGSQLLKTILNQIDETIYDAFVIETSSHASGLMTKNLMPIDSVVNPETGLSTVLKLKITKSGCNRGMDKSIHDWFMQNKLATGVLPESHELTTATGIYKEIMVQCSLKNNSEAKDLFTKLDALVKLWKPNSKQKKVIEKYINEVDRKIKKQMNGPDEKGGTPVQGAAWANDLQTLQKLIKYGADLNIPEPFYQGTVLHVAVDGKSVDCVKDILKHAPHLSMKHNKNGVTALDWAKKLKTGPDDARMNEIITAITNTQSLLEGKSVHKY